MVFVVSFEHFMTFRRTVGLERGHREGRNGAATLTQRSAVGSRSDHRMVGGRWSDGRWSVVGGRWSVVGWSVVDGRWLDGRQRSGGQWSVGLNYKGRVS